MLREERDGNEAGAASEEGSTRGGALEAESGRAGAGEPREGAGKPIKASRQVSPKADSALPPGGSQGPRRGAVMPQMGMEMLRLLFRFGCLTAPQIIGLLPVRRSPGAISRILNILTEAGLVAGSRRTLPLATALPLPAMNGKRAPKRGRPSWSRVNSLTDAGLRFTAQEQGLHQPLARSLYKMVYQDATVDHALLRNQYLAALNTAVDEIEKAARTAGEDPPARIETLCGESGIDPIRVSPSDRGTRRYLNPDGLIEAFTDPKGVPSRRPRSGRVRILLEGDTGSQYHRKQITLKANQYGEYLAYLVDSMAEVRALAASRHNPRAAATVEAAPRPAKKKTEKKGPYVKPAGNTGIAGGDLPRALFFSPNPKRSLWVLDTLKQTAMDPQSDLAKARTRLLKQGGIDLATLFYVTNLEWLEHAGPLGAAYMSLGFSKARGILDPSPPTAP